MVRPLRLEPSAAKPLEDVIAEMETEAQEYLHHPVQCASYGMLMRYAEALKSSKRDSIAPSMLTEELKQLVHEWRERRLLADTDVGYAIRVGCAERLDEILNRYQV